LSFDERRLLVIRLVALKESKLGGGVEMKSMLLGLAAASALLLGTSTVLAAGETEMSQEYSSRVDNANAATPALIDCALAETKRQDARLNENYKRLMSKLTEDRKNRASGSATRLDKVP
jgi:uncharacterized protein YecT (DUF1311 family)